MNAVGILHTQVGPPSKKGFHKKCNFVLNRHILWSISLVCSFWGQMTDAEELVRTNNVLTQSCGLIAD